jgi:hypothetical protein
MRGLQATSTLPARFPVFRQIVSMASMTLPVAGAVTNCNHATFGGHGLTAVGVVMGQGQGSDTSVILAAAGDAAKQLVDSVATGPARHSAGLNAITTRGRRHEWNKHE